MSQMTKVIAKRAFRLALIRGCDLSQWMRVVTNILILNGVHPEAVLREIGNVIVGCLRRKEFSFRPRVA